LAKTLGGVAHLSFPTWLFRTASLLPIIACLATFGLGDYASTNRAMIHLSKCLWRVGWVSDPDRARSFVSQQVPPSSYCLDRVKRLSGTSRRLTRRLEVIAGDIAAARGQWNQALDHYTTAVRLIPSPAPGISAAIVSIYMWQLKDYSTALDIALQALSSSPDDETLRLCAGLLYLYYVPPFNNYARALRAMRPELGFSSSYPYNVAAGAYLAIDELDNGLTMAQHGVRLSRNRADANLATGLYQLGLIQRCLGHTEQGMANLREALTLSPNDVNIQTAFGDDFRRLCGPSQ